MMKGKIVKTGGIELIEKIDKAGYDWIKEELGIIDERVVPKERHKRPSMIGECAARKPLE